MVPTIAPVDPAPVGCERYRTLVTKYNWDTRIALAVMEAESSCRPDAVNWKDVHNGCVGSFGLFQIACYDGQVYDPERNVALAWYKYSKQGWQPWGAYTTGKYLKFLK